MSKTDAVKNTEYQEWMKNVYQRGDVEFVARQSRHARNVHFAILKNDRARGYSDTDLINLADGGIYHFGGYVERHGDQVIIHVYTD